MEEFLKKYNTSEEGLSSSEVTKRQNQNGLNELKEKKKKSAVMLFLEQFIDVLIALLIVAAIAAYFVGDVIDSCVILIAVLLNTVIGFIQEYRSEKAIEMLKSVTTSYAVVRRDGQPRSVPLGPRRPRRPPGKRQRRSLLPENPEPRRPPKRGRKPPRKPPPAKRRPRSPRVRNNFPSGGHTVL